MNSPGDDEREDAGRQPGVDVATNRRKTVRAISINGQGGPHVGQGGGDVRERHAEDLRGPVGNGGGNRGGVDGRAIREEGPDATALDGHAARLVVVATADTRALITADCRGAATLGEDRAAVEDDHAAGAATGSGRGTAPAEARRAAGRTDNRTSGHGS